MTVVTPSGQAGRQQGLGLLGHQGGVGHEVEPGTSSQPWVPYWPRTPGYDRRWVSPSPMAVASTTAPHSTMRWSMRLPSLEANHFSVSHTWEAAWPAPRRRRWPPRWPPPGGRPARSRRRRRAGARPTSTTTRPTTGGRPRGRAGARGRGRRRGRPGGRTTGGPGRGVGGSGVAWNPTTTRAGPHPDAGGLGLGEVLDHAVAGGHRLVPHDPSPGRRRTGPGGEGRLDGGDGEVDHPRTVRAPRSAGTRCWPGR